MNENFGFGNEHEMNFKSNTNLIVFSLPYFLSVRPANALWIDSAVQNTLDRLGKTRDFGRGLWCSVRKHQWNLVVYNRKLCTPSNGKNNKIHMKILICHSYFSQVSLTLFRTPVERVRCLLFNGEPVVCSCCGGGVGGGDGRRGGGGGDFGVMRTRRTA